MRIKFLIAVEWINFFSLLAFKTGLSIFLMINVSVQELNAETICRNSGIESNILCIFGSP